MVTIRCTQKILKRMAGPPTRELAPPTTLLGDWYANLLFSRPQQVLLISERTLLPVVVTARDMPSLAGRFRVALGEVLLAIGVEPPSIEQELAQMRDLGFGRTTNKRVLGSLNDFMYHLDWRTRAEPDQSLFQRSLQLSEMPCAPIGYAFPCDATRELFASTGPAAHALQ